MTRIRPLFLIAAVFLFAPVLRADDAISFESLLEEMTERDEFCEWPNPEFTCRQASSYDRAAVSPSENWFANDDRSKFLRDEMNGDRKEWVLMEADGPGAIVRFWITAPNYVNNLYFYIDGAVEPVIAGPSDQIIGGEGLVGAPLSQETARGRNLYFPIPYAKSVKVTCDKIDEQAAFYYQIDYRTYAGGTKVESFSKEKLTKEKEKIAKTNAELSASGLKAEDGDDIQTRKMTVSVTPGQSSGPIVFDGPATLTQVSGKLTDPNPAALRSTVVTLSFDGEEMVRCPLGDFFGSGVGVNPYRTWRTEVQKDGTMTCFWPMPFKESAMVKVFNNGKEPIEISGVFKMKRTKWTDHSMYFHANWRQEREIETVAGNGTKDWNYLTVSGEGIYVGDVLSLVNRDQAWWGEGDEKIYVDGEKFPSHFGTGTEDYYGYAWGTAEFFDSPWRAQPRAEGPASFGNVTNLRFRSLDAIPFKKDFRFDMEIWHWAATNVDYAVTAFWYGKPGAKAVGMADAKTVDAEAAAPVTYQTPFLLKVPGWKFNAPEKPLDGFVSIQEMKNFGPQWKGNQQLFWIKGKSGNRLPILVHVEKENPKFLRVGLTAACDYGIVQFWLDGKKLGAPLDLYHPDKVVHLEEVFGLTEPLSAGEHQVDVEIVGKNEKSADHFFGTDFFAFE